LIANPASSFPGKRLRCNSLQGPQRLSDFVFDKNLTSLLLRFKNAFDSQVAYSHADAAAGEIGLFDDSGRQRDALSPRSCRRFEVPTAVAANTVRNSKSRSGTRVMDLLVSNFEVRIEEGAAR
jgi:hypothetical protein